MKCIYCGAEIPENSIFCNQCGKEAQMVPESSVLEDEYLGALIGNENPTMEIPYVDHAKAMEHANEQRRLERQKKQEQKRKETQKTIILGSVLAVVILLVAILGVNIYQSGNYDYQITKAEAAVEKGQTDKAIALYEKAIKMNSTDVSSRMKLAELYESSGQTDGAKVMYMEVIGLDSSNRDAYEGLVNLYEKEGNTDAIILLSQTVKDESVLDIFSNYMVDGPSFNLQGGTYNRYIHVELSAPEDAVIYYTTDRTDPITYGKVYALPIELNEMKSYTISAVVKNEKGVYSSVVTNEYTISIPKPELPVVYPDGGEFNQETFVLIEVPEGYQAYYTWDGSDPNILSALYVEPFAIPSGNHVLSVMIIDPVTEQYSDIYRNYFTYYP